METKIELTEEQIQEALKHFIVGSGAYKYSGKSNYGKPKTEYLTKLIKMSDEELFTETKEKIWLSAYAANNGRSDYHWHCDGTYDEWRRRGKDNQYDKAHKQVVAENK